MYNHFKLFLKEINLLLKSEMKEMGFKKKGQRYIRIVNNQILQVLEFQSFTLEETNTMINIIIVPLCSKCRMSIRWCQERECHWRVKDKIIIYDIIKTNIIKIFRDIDTYEKLMAEYEDYILNPPIRERDATKIQKWDLKKELFYIYGYNMFYEMCIRLDRKELLLKAIKKEKDNIKDLYSYFIDTNEKYKNEVWYNTQMQSHKAYTNKLLEKNIMFEKTIQENYENIKDEIRKNEIINLEELKNFIPKLC